ncbi:hypothetical protein PV04_10970 [Phialophora macrospora]|uniref:Aminoglycoside phosphotransferase domain-containing protein n=1 Tax=Phialophora macrospora TaxID=1851006 RepID=A0A0D2F7A9_9EURO|nr:hypothetical protein PV04_10970 [Phialophora macrospora]
MQGSMTPSNQIPLDETTLKRRLSDNGSVEHTQEPRASLRPSEAAALNQRVLRKLHRFLADNPEVDLLSLFPTDYSTRLKLRINEPSAWGKEASQLSKQAAKERSKDDIRFQIDCSCPAEEIYPLSPSIQHLVTAGNRPFDGSEVSHRLSELLWKCEVIYQGPIPQTRTVFQLGSEAVIKVISNAHDYTEYTTLQYLERVSPEFPAPKPLGVLRIGHLSFIIATYIPGRSLQDVWPALTRDQKLSIKDKLQQIVSTLRSIRR